MPNFTYEPTFQLSKDSTPYRLLTKDHVEVIQAANRTFLKIHPEGLTLLAQQAFHDLAFYFRTSHLKQLAEELKDPEASDNDRFVLYTHLQNAVTASAGQLPSCQDTGTAAVLAKKGQYVLTDTDDPAAISEGIYQTYQTRNLRYSQLAPLEMFKEKNTATNLPAQIDIMSEPGDEYSFLFVAKGGGSANKMYLYQSTPALLNEKDFDQFIRAKLKDLGTSACPPYHLAVVVGGSSAETCMKTLKLATAHYYDHLPDTGSESGRAFRDKSWEARILKIAQDSKIGAQFGGKYFAHDVRVIRLPRHAASCPIAIGVSCSADRNIKAKITKDGIFLEQLEFHPEQYLPQQAPELAPPIQINLNEGMDKVRAILSKFPVKTRLELTGTLIVARDSAHARIKQMLDQGQPMPDYFKNHPIYYAGPAKTPQGMPTGSFGPTTAGRMDSFVDLFQSQGGSLVMLAKGNRSKSVTTACQKHGGFYLGSIGGPAAILAQTNIKSVSLVDFEDLGMEAIRKIEVVKFPAFIIVDNKGNDFFEEL
ncbi:MAG TPA: FumA C-terminus/TtdB family hydratase beta subunit [Tepidisphaeraceae bacterium]|jgi:fumarate hydratase class I|nr:FumA C-terminus/TtdB family hydratase beta subunit [Tepidisphaeraceae bacterium]